MVFIIYYFPTNVMYCQFRDKWLSSARHWNCLDRNSLVNSFQKTAYECYLRQSHSHAVTVAPCERVFKANRTRSAVVTYRTNATRRSSITIEDNDHCWYLRIFFSLFNLAIRTYQRQIDQLYLGTRNGFYVIVIYRSICLIFLVLSLKFGYIDLRLLSK